MNIRINKITASLLIVQLLVSITAQAGRSKKIKECCNKPFGEVVRCYGPNIATDPNAFVKCTLFNDEGCEIGFEETLRIPTDPTVASHKVALKDGCLKLILKVDTDVFTLVPAAQAVSAFPEIAPFVNTPNAHVLFLNGNHSKTDSGSIAWNGSGSLKEVNYLEVRCVYLALVDPSTGAISILQALGCHYFLGTKA